MNWDASLISTIYFFIEWAIRIGALFIVPLRRPPTAATAWLVLIFFLPLFGLALYLFVGRPRVSLQRAEKIMTLADTLKPNTDRILKARLQDRAPLPARFASLEQLAAHWRVFPVFAGNHAELIREPQAFIDMLVEDIDQARDHVHMTFYIAARDHLTEPVFRALIRAAKRGVAVRLLVDDFGSKHFIKRLTPLTQEGIELARAFPRSKVPSRSARFDLRNHRKLIVIDGVTGYSGSMNLIAPTFKPGVVYEDLMMRLSGPVVLELQTIFVGDWFVETHELLEGPVYFPEPVAAGDESCISLPSGPEYPEPVLQRLLLAMIYASHEAITIVTPYFVPDEPTLDALKVAANRGVNCQLIVSEKLDQRLVQRAQESYYAELLEAGVRIYRHPSRLLHSKITLCDHQISLVGSANLDVRSSLINAELGLLFYSPKTATNLNYLVAEYRSKSIELSAAQWAQRPKWRTLSQNIARLTSPLL
ncbi:MAG TPA: cardiolipin synthase [Halothiobacillaceae bacterium]|nr:cardiolipin synthase [Halothiobacillaceae bacterium]